MITTDQIQSIVDGECSCEARALILKSIEDQPSGWRSLALAFLEEQQWSKELSAIAPNNCLQQLSTLNSRVQPLDQLASLSDFKNHSQTRAVPWMPVLAASLLLGFGVFGGMMLKRMNSLWSDAPEQQLMGGSNKNAKASESVSSNQLMKESDMKMLVSGPNQEKSEIPIYDLNISDHDLRFAKEEYEIAKINQRLRREGYELDVRPEYYTGKLSDGRNLIVPVKNVGVRPYGL